MALLSVVGNRAVARKECWLVRCQVALYGNQGVRGENEFMRELYPMHIPNNHSTTTTTTTTITTTKVRIVQGVSFILFASKIATMLPN